MGSTYVIRRNGIRVYLGADLLAMKRLLDGMPKGSELVRKEDDVVIAVQLESRRKPKEEP